MRTSEIGHGEPFLSGTEVARTRSLPRRIALIDAESGKSAVPTSLILDDFAEAFDVYAHHDAVPGALVPELIRVDRRQDGGSDASELPDLDTIVLGCSLEQISPPGSASRLIGPIPEGTRLYAIASDERYGLQAVPGLLDPIKDSCSRCGIAWCGCLVAYASAMIPMTARSARMGVMRRHLSEATDRLILAVRCGTDAGMIETRAPVPRFIYRSIVKRREMLQSGGEEYPLPDSPEGKPRHQRT